MLASIGVYWPGVSKVHEVRIDWHDVNQTEGSFCTEDGVCPQLSLIPGLRIQYLDL